MNGTARPARPTRTNVPPLPYGDDPYTTCAIPAPWLKPPVTAVYRTPRARRGAHWRAFLSSSFVADLNPLRHGGTFGTTVALAVSLLAIPTTQFAAVVA